MSENKQVNTTEYIKMIKESPEKRKSYVFAAITFAVALILIVFAVRPTVLTITRINKEIKTKEMTKAQLESKITALNSLDAQYVDIEDDMEDLQLIFPADGNFSLFLSNIDAVVSRNGFALRGINFDEYGGESYDINSNVLMPWSVRVTVKGKRVNLINFLKDLESLPMYPVIDAVSYNSQTDEDGLNTFSVSMRIYHIENNKFFN